MEYKLTPAIILKIKISQPIQILYIYIWIQLNGKFWCMQNTTTVGYNKEHCDIFLQRMILLSNLKNITVYVKYAVI